MRVESARFLLAKKHFSEYFTAMTHLAVPIAANTITEVAHQAQVAKDSCADIIELRIDYLENLTLAISSEAICAARTVGLPVIVTCRDKAQGGQNDYPLELRTNILAAAVNAGADHIDCEYDNFKIPRVREKIVQSLSTAPRAKLILSAHNFKGPWARNGLVDLYEEITADFPAAIPKLIYKAKHINDIFGALDLLHNKKGELITFCMSEAGLPSRIIAKKLGAYLTFASVDDKKSTAPGQITIDRMRNTYRFDSINEDTKLLGVIGSPIKHSMGPAMFNACFDAQRMNALYLHLLVGGDEKKFARFMDNVVEREYLDFCGFSVTLPHKANAVEYVDKGSDTLDQLAEDIGAVNTLKVGYNKSVSGFNTDCAGAIDALTETLGINKHDLHNIEIAVVGAGGVSRAVVAGLSYVGARVTIYNRTVSKAESLAEEFGCKFASLDDIDSMDAKVIINCTSIGMSPDVDSTPVPVECIKPDMVVFDTVYNPLKTKLLSLAEQAGAKTVNGAEMFIRQAVEQFHIFLSAAPDRDVMRQTVYSRLQ